jgi:hypothetical protein
LNKKLSLIGHTEAEPHLLAEQQISVLNEALMKAKRCLNFPAIARFVHHLVISA